MSKIVYEDYVIPPSYVERQDSGDNQDDYLISKLKGRIQQDLNQINGVYDTQITEAVEKKKKLVQKLEVEYVDIIDRINKNRTQDISKYNEKAEKHIDNLISTMHNSPQTVVVSWLGKIFGVLKLDF